MIKKKSKCKQAGQRHFPNSQKKPTISDENRIAIDKAWKHCPVWQFSILDFSYPRWGWKNFKGESLCRDVLRKLADYESMTWQEIFNDKKRNHPVLIKSLPSQVQKCISELKLDDIDQLHRLRLNGQERVWGILEGYIFKIIWWDPKHTVCPSPKKNT